MVRINSDIRNEQENSNNKREVRNLEKMQKEYDESQARTMRRISGDVVPNGDPPSLMLWGDE